jgi:hypothetical protein
MTAISGPTTRPLHDSTDSLLRFAMRLDGTVSGLVGLAGAVFADPLSSLTGRSSIEEYSMGGLFVLYGLAVFGLAALPNVRRAGIGLVAANSAYTVASIAAAELVPMTGIGVALTLATGVCTAFFAALQYLGVRRLAV